jgi:hypothetical protein
MTTNVRPTDQTGSTLKGLLQFSSKLSLVTEIDEHVVQ